MSKEVLKLALDALELNNDEWKSLADSGDSGYWKAEDQDHYQQTNKAIAALREALAEQPARQQNGPINEGWQITVAHGHSGYGVYAHMEDYPEEGAVLVQAIEQPAKLEPVVWKWQQAPIRTAWGDDMAVASVAIDKDHTVDLYCEREQIAKVEVMFTSPPAQRKPLTDEQEREAFEAHWYTKYHAGSIHARSNGSYFHRDVQRAWEAWQARAAQE